MVTALQLALAFVLPTAAGYAVVAVRRLLRLRRERGRPAARDQPIERVGADLRRLRATLDEVELAVGLPAKRLRRDAVRAAYVDALTTACQQLDVPPPEPGRAGRVAQSEIYRVEHALRGRGLDVRPG